MNCRSLIVVCLAFGILSHGARAQNRVVRYNLTDIGALTGYSYSRAYGINDKGQIVGQVATIEKLGKNPPQAHAVLWQDGKVESISLPKILEYGVARGINDQGQITVGSEIQNYGAHGFDFAGMKDQACLWKDGKITSLLADDAHAYGINNKGQVVGQSGSQATLWQNGKAMPLTTAPHSRESCAYAISKEGQTAGVCFDEKGKRQATLWNNGTFQMLEMPQGEDQSVACAINDAGVVVGSCGHDNSYWNIPCAWRGGKLDTLYPLDGRTWINEVLGINNHDQVVGCGMKDGVYMHAVLWENHIPRDLNDLILEGSGLTLMKATAINDKGQIVGEAGDDKGQIHAFLLTPTEGK